MVSAALIALAAYAGPEVLAVATMVVAAALAWGWAGTLGLPSSHGTTAVLGVAAVALGYAPLFAGASDRPVLTWLPVAVAASLIAAFVHQILRRDGRPRMVVSVASTTLGIALIASGSTLIPLGGLGHWGDNPPWELIAAGMAAVAASVLVVRMRWASGAAPWMIVFAMIAGVVAASVVGVYLGERFGHMALVGAVSAGISEAIRGMLLSRPETSLPRPQLTVAAASVLAPGVALHIISRLIML